MGKKAVQSGDNLRNYRYVLMVLLDLPGLLTAKPANTQLRPEDWHKALTDGPNERVSQ